MSGIRINHNGNYGHTLTGDEVHRLLSKQHIESVIAILLPTKVNGYIFDNGSYSTAKEWITLLAALHHICMTASNISGDALNRLKQLVDQYCMLRSAHIMDSSVKPMRPLTPKEHVLICHFYTFAEQFGTIGILSEHGMEAQHAHFNQLQRQFACVQQTQQRLTHVMKQNMLTHHDSINTVKRKHRTCSQCSKPIAKHENFDYCVCVKSKRARTA
jgi:hypothetical protein